METKEILQQWLISAITFGYKWLTTDAEILGYILAVLHVLVATTLMVCYTLSHTVYPTWQFKLGLFVCLLVVWLQHIFFNVCIATVAELSLTKIQAPSNIYLSYVFNKLLGTTLSDVMIHLVLCETVAVYCFGLEMVSLLANYIYTIYNYDLA